MEAVWVEQKEQMHRDNAYSIINWKKDYDWDFV